MQVSHVLIIDGYNFIHRARAGFTAGDHALVFNFFRNLRALVEQHNPNRVVITLEGHPEHRYKIDEDYKANRRVDAPTDEQLSEHEKFQRQKTIIVTMLKNHFPVSVMHHPKFEGDDLIYNVIARSSASTQFTVVSNDTDFIQLLDEFDNVRIWNPMKKTYVEKPAYDYVTWKSLCGDSSDNIKGIPGVGKKTAEKLALDDDKRKRFFEADAEREKTFESNVSMIRFFRFDDETLQEVTTSCPDKKNWVETIEALFQAFHFRSLLKEKTFKKFIDTFEPLWG